MSKILRLSKRLADQTPPSVDGNWLIRPFSGDPDALRWIELRTAAFADLVTATRPWTRDDFEREFVTKPWWSPGRMWFALAMPESRSGADVAASSVLGTITLGRSGRPPHDVASLQWLMVAPNARRRGIATALLAELERSAWACGDRCLTLETHADWTDAVAFYRRHGYEE